LATRFTHASMHHAHAIGIRVFPRPLPISPPDPYFPRSPSLRPVLDCAASLAVALNVLVFPEPPKGSFTHSVAIGRAAPSVLVGSASNQRVSERRHRMARNEIETSRRITIHELGPRTQSRGPGGRSSWPQYARFVRMRSAALSPGLLDGQTVCDAVVPLDAGDIPFVLARALRGRSSRPSRSPTDARRRRRRGRSRHARDLPASAPAVEAGAPNGLEAPRPRLPGRHREHARVVPVYRCGPLVVVPSPIPEAPPVLLTCSIMLGKGGVAICVTAHDPCYAAHTGPTYLRALKTLKDFAGSAPALRYGDLFPSRSAASRRSSPKQLPPVFWSPIYVRQSRHACRVVRRSLLQQRMAGLQSASHAYVPRQPRNLRLQQLCCSLFAS